MQGKYTGFIRGLGIAAIALSAIALLACLFCAIVLGMVGSAFGSGMMNQLSYELIHEFDYYYGPMVAGGLDSVAGLVAGIIGLMVGWEVLTCIVSLIAGILGTRNAGNPAKLGGLFGWGIAGAAAALLGGRIITMALLIIMAVLAKKTQDDMNKAQWAGVAAGQSQGPVYGQPAYAQPAQPVSQPANPTPYQQTYAPQAAPAAIAMASG